MTGGSAREVEHGRATVNGVELHYVVAGHGPTVLLLHGWPVTWRHFARLVPLLIADGWRVVAPDLRGLGDSGSAPGPFSTPALAEDVARLAAHLGVTRCAVLGHDWGGSVAYALAAAHRELVTHLAVEEELLPGFRVELSGEGARRYPSWHGGFHAAPGVAEMLVPNHEREYLGIFWGLTHEQDAIGPGEREEYLRTYAGPEALHSWLAYYREAPADAEWNRRAAAEPLRIPVLALGGASAMGAAVTASVRHVAIDVTSVVLPECAHYPSHEQPEAVRRILTAFLRQ